MIVSRFRNPLQFGVRLLDIRLKSRSVCIVFKTTKPFGSSRTSDRQRRMCTISKNPTHLWILTPGYLISQTFKNGHMSMVCMRDGTSLIALTISGDGVRPSLTNVYSVIPSTSLLPTCSLIVCVKNRFRTHSYHARDSLYGSR